METEIRLTEFTTGGGCGCKIAPDMLERLVKPSHVISPCDRLLVGNRNNDDAAVYDIGGGQGIISTTDFFTPIVDDPFTFGQIAATNALSDIYAMGGTPLMAIAIFGWPIDDLPITAGQQVIEGGRAVCQKVGIPLAGGHSISSREPIFGLAATGSVAIKNLKENSTARVGDLLFLTKPVGIGILTAAHKKNILDPKHSHLAAECMLQLNDVGSKLANVSGVTAMTDVTGFGLIGHLSEMCRGSGVGVQLDMNAVPLIDECVKSYRYLGAVPGGTDRNWRSCKELLKNSIDLEVRQLLCDPQTSGGLLVSVKKNSVDEVKQVLSKAGSDYQSIGEFVACEPKSPCIHVKV